MHPGSQMGPFGALDPVQATMHQMGHGNPLQHASGRVYEVDSHGLRRSPRKSTPAPGPPPEERVEVGPTKSIKKPAKGKKSKKNVESDEEIAKADPKQLVSLKIKTDSAESDIKNTKKWTEEEAVDMVEYICEPARWDGFKLNQKAIFDKVW